MAPSSCCRRQNEEQPAADAICRPHLASEVAARVAKARSDSSRQTAANQHRTANGNARPPAAMRAVLRTPTLPRLRIRERCWHRQDVAFACAESPARRQNPNRNDGRDHSRNPGRYANFHPRKPAISVNMMKPSVPRSAASRAASLFARADSYRQQGSTASVKRNPAAKNGGTNATTSRIPRNDPPHKK